jgi:hypothetical protein
MSVADRLSDPSHLRPLRPLRPAGRLSLAGLSPLRSVAYNIAHEKVIRCIRSGALRAINVATRPTQRERWVIDPFDLADFQNRRSNHEAGRPTARRRRTPRNPAGIFELIK